MDLSQKIHQDLPSLLEQVSIWKKDGKRIVFTNGCFDLLHRGHVDYLNKAKSLGDLLIVALNTDASVSKLKGPHRPLQSEQDRMFIMAGLQAVDAVILFAEETPLNLILAILPNILTKGGDYQFSTIVGAKEVFDSGGSVIILPFIEGRSTSEIERRILQSRG